MNQIEHLRFGWALEKIERVREILYSDDFLTAEEAPMAAAILGDALDLLNQE